MSAPTADREVEQHAITDLYDARGRTFLVMYPVRLVVALSLAGVASFVLIGFLGYRDSAESELTYRLFKQPWPLFLWFCALIMLLQASIFRHPTLRRQRLATLGVTTASILIVGATYYYNPEIRRLLQYLLENLLNIQRVIPELGKSKYVYFLINFGLIAVFWADTLRRWVRGARGLPVRRPVNLGLGQPRRAKQTNDDVPTMQELISGDLIAGAVLTLLLSLVFRADVINFFSDALQINVNITTCTVSWPVGACLGGGGLADPPTLSFIDLMQTLLYLPIGLLILALTALLSGFEAVGGVDDQPSHDHGASEGDETGTTSVTEQVGLTLLHTLRSALNRRLQLAMGNLALSLRNVTWPALILLGTIAVASAARSIQRYLHLLSDQRTCATAACPEFAIVHEQLSTGQQYVSMGLAVVWGSIAVLAIVFAAALLVFSVRVIENTLRFLGLTGFIVLVTFWLFSLALSGINALLSLVCGANSPVCGRVPFPQPGVSTIVSFSVLLLYAAMWVTSRARGRGPRVAVPIGSRKRDDRA